MDSRGIERQWEDELDSEVLDSDGEFGDLSGAGLVVAPSAIEAEMFLAAKEGKCSVAEATQLLKRLGQLESSWVLDWGSIGYHADEYRNYGGSGGIGLGYGDGRGSESGDEDEEEDDLSEWTLEGALRHRKDKYYRSLKRIERLQDRVGQRLYALWCRAGIAINDMQEISQLRLKVWAGNAGAAGSLALLMLSYADELKGTGYTTGLATAGSLAAVYSYIKSSKMHKEVVRLGKLKAIQKEMWELEERIKAGAEDPGLLDLMPTHGKSRALFLALRMVGIEVTLISENKGFALRRYVVAIVNQAASHPHYAVGVREVSERASDLKIALRCERRPIVEACGPEGGVAIDVVLNKDERKIASFWEYIIERKGPGVPDEKEIGRRMLLPAGVDNFTGELRFVDLSNPTTAHLLIAGTTGSGKTHLALNMLWTVGLWYSSWVRPKAGYSLQVACIVIDPKRTFPSKMTDYMPHVVHHLTAEEEIREELERTAVAMVRRNELMGDYDNIYSYNEATAETGVTYPIYLIFVDELTEVCKDKIAMEHLEKIARMGRNTGFHIISNTQRPSADVISTQLRSNLPGRIMLHVASEFDSWIITGEQNPKGRWLGDGGDMYLIGENPEGERLIGLYFEEYDKAMKSPNGVGDLKRKMKVQGGWLSESIRQRRSELGLNNADVNVEVQVEALADDVEYRQTKRQLEKEARERLYLTYGIPTEEHEAVIARLQKIIGSQQAYTVYREYRTWVTSGKSRTKFLEHKGCKADDLSRKAMFVLVRQFIDDWMQDLLHLSDEEAAVFMWGANRKAKGFGQILQFVQDSRKRLMRLLKENTNVEMPAEGEGLKYEHPIQLHEGVVLPTAEELDEMEGEQLSEAINQLNEVASATNEAISVDGVDLIEILLARIDERQVRTGSVGIKELLLPVDSNQLVSPSKGPKAKVPAKGQGTSNSRPNMDAILEAEEESKLEREETEAEAEQKRERELEREWEGGM